MKVSITSGKSEGPSRLNALDNALLDAGIGDVNLIKVSSIIPPNTRIIRLPPLEPGSMVNCVLSHSISDNKGDIISAAIAVALSDNIGCVAENSGINKDPKIIREEAIFMVEYMMKRRGEKIKNLIVEEINHKVKECGAVVAALIYLK
ncbi:pyruvoyl-dependent arginine decarboxylase [Methanothermobacter sp. MT-2]|nr:pyruvoyl-dependent arginine decarboxylase [Methanothermobacter sp. MT-2]HHW05324.1 arginine decarboxylase, pyruvoyl-dependent [Methanothermobacter sp.]HOK72936.1 arginine decarboxylase, pyruvoyl-dependent [Methanothermobacter sp.]HPQ05365.1 arginine decarboxylase, pyruvoyl-dependent [Methanothermobacter sp.]HPU36808.1 arginine decarboxylase, pyruvoyl-dependent [Methanothermobacter sp.]